MLRLMRIGLAVLAMGFLLTGCSKPGPELVKQHITVMNEWAAEFEKVTDEESMNQARPLLAAYGEKLGKIIEKLNALEPEVRQAAIDANKADWDLAVARFGKAKADAGRKAHGAPKATPGP